MFIAADTGVSVNHSLMNHVYSVLSSDELVGP